MSNYKDRIVHQEKEYSTPCVFFPNAYKDLSKIIECLESGHNVIVNVSNMQEIGRFRIIDFLSGFIYAKKGKREKLEENIFLFSLI